MRVQRRWLLLAVAGFCLLGRAASESVVRTSPSPDDDDVPGVEPLNGDTDPKNLEDPTKLSNEAKNEFDAKENDSKSNLDGKKKMVTDFKAKTDSKYQKGSKDDPSQSMTEETPVGEPSPEPEPDAKPKPNEKPTEAHESMENSSEKQIEEPTPTAEPSPKVIEGSTTTSKPAGGQNTVVEEPGEPNKNLLEQSIPFLLRGEPILTSFNSSTQAEHTMEPVPSAEPSTEEPKHHQVTEATPAPRGRALNVSAPEPTNSLHANLTDLSDVSMDDEDTDVQGGEYLAGHNESRMNFSSTMLPTAGPACIDRNVSYAIGDKITRDCDETCVCGEGGKIMDCKPMCVSPFVRSGRGFHDPLCEERSVKGNACCSVMVCAEDSEPEPDESCVYGNRTLSRGERVEDGCSKVCVCEAQGKLKCQPRCPPNETTSGVNQHDRCVALSDPKDACCTITLCDVTLGDHEIKPEMPGETSVTLTDVKLVNSTAIKLKLSTNFPEHVTIEISGDNHVWREQKPNKDGIISNLEPNRTYHVRVTEGGRSSPALQIYIPAEVIKENAPDKSDKNMCNFRGKSYKIGAEWYDECISFCICGEGGKSECVTIECPTDFGLDVLDPHCLDWETVPANFEPKAPHCCPQEVRCKNNGSCSYEGQFYHNWSELPANVTGCEKRCYCEMGNVSCQAACPPVTALPPPNLPCPPHHASLTHLPGEECCLHWVCGQPPPPTIGKNVTPAFPGPLATDSIDQLLTEDSKRLNNKTEKPRPNQDPDRAASFPREDPENINSYPDTTNHELFHYPMDPGHPTVPYNGPFSPDYRPTHPTVEQIFRLPSHPEKTAPPIKEKSKSKSDSKKAVETTKPHKETIEQQFPGPFAPDRLSKPIVSTTSSHSHSNENENLSGSMNPNKLPPSHKGVHVAEQPQFIPLNTHDGSGGPPFIFSPHNGENIPLDQFGAQYDNPETGPPYRGPFPVRTEPSDPNFIGPMNPKKKIANDPFSNDHKSKPLPPVLPGKPKPGQRNPEEEILPEELYHLINLQHPGLIQLNRGPPQGHQGLYEIHQQVAGQKNLPNQLQTGFFSPPPPPVQKKTSKPQIFTQKGENGETTYHIHTPEIPNSPQQIEELLAHINQHDSNPGPFQSYPGQPSIVHNIPSGPPPPLPPRIDAHIPQNPAGLTHLNHPFAAQTPNQSGMEENLPLGFPIPGGFPGLGQGAQSSSNEVTVQTLEALDENNVRLVFTVPTVLVGLHGRVELRYTNDKMNFDPSTWKSQVFAPPNDLIATPQLEFELGDLKPSTDYKVKITVKLRDLTNNPTSKIYSVRTLDKLAEETTLPPQIPIDPELTLTEANSTWVNVMWKKFTDYELQFIDGVQLRYKEHDGKVYAATPLIHRAVTSYLIENLKPSTGYEVGIYFIPFPGQATELVSEKTVHVTTAMEPDPYSFDVKVDIKTIKSTDVEVSWSGVPYPEDKYVNIYRAIYQSDSGKEDTSTFKIAKRDSPAKTIISDLKPGTRYRLWIEVYLTNGRIKKSNVQDFVTKPGVPLAAGISQQGKLASLPLHEGDYYGPLVIVAIVASLAILSTLILLMMLMKRRTSSKADISPRKTTSAYDNPSYKTCEERVTISNGHNRNPDHEMATINHDIQAKEPA